MGTSRLRGGYFALEISLRSEGSPVHVLYLKEHSAGASGSKSKTLFVGNVDLVHEMAHEDISAYLRELFGPLGEVESVSISSFAEAQGKGSNSDNQNALDAPSSSHLSSTPSRFAHVVFSKSSAVKAILHAAASGLLASSTSVSQISKHWALDRVLHAKSSRQLRESFPFVDVDRIEMKRRVDDAMAEFEEQEQLARLERERASRQADEDGFMPVQHRKKRKRQSEGGRKGGNSNNSTGRNRSNKKRVVLASSELGSGLGSGSGAGTGVGAEPSAPKTLKNFYGFQQKEERQNTLLRLRRQFEEDRAKVAKMREQRKFKPF